MSADPNSVADAPTPEDVLHKNRRKIARDMLIRLDAAGWEVNPAGTASMAALWQSNTEGAIADAGDLPGDLTAWSAIRRLTAQRDDLAARLAVAEAAHLATYETVSRRADAAEARLSALTDAIEAMFGVVDSEYQPTIFLRPVPTSQMERVPDAVTAVLAAAVQPPDPKGTK
jgi:hypothetical protein